VVGYQFKIRSYWKQEAGISIFSLFHWVQYQRVGPVNHWQNSVTLNALLF
jgi:hypothetical protein